MDRVLIELVVSVFILGMTTLFIIPHYWKRYKDKRNKERWVLFKKAIYDTLVDKGYNQVLLDHVMQFLEDYYNTFCIYGKGDVISGVTRDINKFVETQIRRQKESIDYRVQSLYNDYVKSRNSQKTTRL